MKSYTITPTYRSFQIFIYFLSTIIFLSCENSQQSISSMTSTNSTISSDKTNEYGESVINQLKLTTNKISLSGNDEEFKIIIQNFSEIPIDPATYILNVQLGDLENRLDYQSKEGKVYSFSTIEKPLSYFSSKTLNPEQQIEINMKLRMFSNLSAESITIQLNHDQEKQEVSIKYRKDTSSEEGNNSENKVESDNEENEDIESENETEDIESEENESDNTENNNGEEVTQTTPKNESKPVERNDSPIGKNLSEKKPNESEEANDNLEKIFTDTSIYNTPKKKPKKKSSITIDHSKVEQPTSNSDTNQQNIDKLYTFIQEGNYKKTKELVEQLIKQGININNPNRQADDYTPLTAAIITENKQITKLLIRKGADRDEISGKLLLTPCGYAIATANLDMLKLLLSKGAIINTQEGSEDLNMVSSIIINKKRFKELAAFLESKGYTVPQKQHTDPRKPYNEEGIKQLIKQSPKKLQTQRKNLFSSLGNTARTLFKV